MVKKAISLFVLLSILFLMDSCMKDDPNDDNIALRTVPTTNNPRLVPEAGKPGLPGMRRGGQ